MSQAGEVSRVRWHGLDALCLQNERLRVITVPALGAKLASLVDRRTGREWLLQPTGEQLAPATYGDTFVGTPVCGWDEMFPTIDACAFPAPGAHAGAALPDHGEVWALPWAERAADPGAITLEVRGKALPYTLTRTITLAADGELGLHYVAANLGREPLPYLWAAHPLFACEQETRILLPPAITEVLNLFATERWPQVDRPLPWPAAAGDERRLDRCGPPASREGQKLYALPETAVSWAALLQPATGAWLRMEWSADQAPYLGIWIDQGIYAPIPAVALEPTTGFYDSLERAWRGGRVAVLAPGAQHAWSVRVRVGSDGRPGLGV